MSQTTLTAFFSSRKRAATDDIFSSKSKKSHIERSKETKSGRRTPTPCPVKGKEPTEDGKIQSALEKTVSTEQKCEVKKKDDSEPFSSKKPAEKEKTGVAFAKKGNANNVGVKLPSKSEVVSVARQDLSLGDIRKKLASSSRLAELRATADRLSKGIQHLRETTDQRNLKQFKSLDVEVPQSPSKRAQVQNEFMSPKNDEKQQSPAEQRLLMSPRKVVVSPIKSPSKVPAYIRHAALAASPTTLPLPHQYRFLAEIFRGMETVVSLLYNRNEKITFAKLKPSVQEMLKRNFTEKHLAQIKHLVPDFYNFEVQKIKHFSTSSHKESYELIVTPNFPNDIKGMNPTVLLERRRYFYDTLQQLVKKHHSQYLLTLDPPMVIPDSKLTRWHPEFELEKVPEVESAKLPEIPDTEKYSSAQDVLAKARELFKCNTKMERALEKLAQAQARGLTDQEKTVTGIEDKTSKSISNAGTQTSQPSTHPPTSGVTILNPALRNLPASLLEKVKARQAAKALEAMTRSAECDQKYLIYSRLPDLARTLRNIFVTERKNVLALNIILSKLDSSFKANVSASDLQKDIKVLTEEAPEWVKLHDIRNTSYLKLDRSTDLKAVISKLDVLAKKYKAD